MSTPAAKPSCSEGGAGTVVHFSEEDEVKLLKCYLEMGRSKKGKEKNPHPSVDSPTLDRIQAALGPAFSHSRVADKLHRLKLQYHKFARTKSLVKTPHQRTILDMGRAIWGKSPTPTPTPTPTTTPTPRMSPRRFTQQRSPATATSKGVDLNHFPFVVSEFSRQFPGNGVWKKGLREMEEKTLEGMNQSWGLLHTQEAELNARRAALLHRQFGITHTSKTSSPH